MKHLEVMILLTTYLQLVIICFASNLNFCDSGTSRTADLSSWAGTGKPTEYRDIVKVTASLCCGKPLAGSRTNRGHASQAGPLENVWLAAEIVKNDHGKRLAGSRKFPMNS